MQEGQRGKPRDVHVGQFSSTKSIGNAAEMRVCQKPLKDNRHIGAMVNKQMNLSGCPVGLSPGRALDCATNGKTPAYSQSIQLLRFFFA